MSETGVSKALRGEVESSALEAGYVVLGPLPHGVTRATLLAALIALNWVTATAKENVELRSRMPERIVERLDPNQALQQQNNELQGTVTQQADRNHWT
jgi:hypothetical protein